MRYFSLFQSLTALSRDSKKNNYRPTHHSWPPKILCARPVDISRNSVFLRLRKVRKKYVIPAARPSLKKANRNAETRTFFGLITKINDITSIALPNKCAIFLLLPKQFIQYIQQYTFCLLYISNRVAKGSTLLFGDF